MKIKIKYMAEGRLERGVNGGYVERENVQANTRDRLNALRAEISPRDQDWARLMNRAYEMGQRGENLQRILALRFDLPENASWDDIRPLWEAHEKLRLGRHFGLGDHASWAQIDSLRGEEERLAEGAGNITVKPPPIAGL